MSPPPTNDSNRVVQSLWVGGALSAMERLSIQSFLDHGHQFNLYTYDEVGRVPDGTTVLDAEQILPRDRIFRYRQDGFGKGSLSGFGNLFRLQLLHDIGGWWVDCDMVCVRPLDFEDPIVIASSWEPKVLQHRGVNNCALRFPPGHPAVAEALHRFNQIDVDQMEFAEAGPVLLKQVVSSQGLREHVVDWRCFCPIGYRDFEKMVQSPDLRSVARRVRRAWTGLPQVRVPQQARCVHLWGNMWREAGLDKDGAYPPRSLYERLKAKHFTPVDAGRG